MSTFPDFISLPLAQWVDKAMDWILINYAGFFSTIGSAILFMLLRLEQFFLWIPWWVLVLAVVFMAWRIMGKWWYGILMGSFLMIIGSFGYWDLAMMTIALTCASVIICLIIGIPVGVIMAENDLVESVLKPILDAMQTMPSFVYLVPALMFFGLGKVPAVFATVIYAMPPVIRLTNVGIRQVPREVIEAAKAFGANSRQLLFEAKMPLAVPSIMVGINQTTMMALAMVVIASMIGARGLGLEVLLSINRIEIGRGLEAGISIVLIAIIIDRLTNAIARKSYHSPEKGG